MKIVVFWFPGGFKAKEKKNIKSKREAFNTKSVIYKTDCVNELNRKWQDLVITEGKNT